MRRKLLRRPAHSIRQRAALSGLMVEVAHQRYQMMRTQVARHMNALPAVTAMALLTLRAWFSYSHAAMAAFEPTQTNQVHNECWLESPLW